MAKRVKEETVDQNEVVDPESKGSKKKFIVLDSNGKTFRVVEDEEKALTIAKEIGGRLAR